MTTYRFNPSPVRPDPPTSYVLGGGNNGNLSPQELRERRIRALEQRNLGSDLSVPSSTRNDSVTNRTLSRSPPRSSIRSRSISRSPTRQREETSDIRQASPVQMRLSPISPPTRTSGRSATRSPTRSSARSPTRSPNRLPTRSPNRLPTRSPNRLPTRSPSSNISFREQNYPTPPTLYETRSPTRSTSRSPARYHTWSPTRSPAEPPARYHTWSPTRSPAGPPERPPTELLMYPSTESSIGSSNDSFSNSFSNSFNGTISSWNEPANQSRPSELIQNQSRSSESPQTSVDYSEENFMGSQSQQGQFSAPLTGGDLSSSDLTYATAPSSFRSQLYESERGRSSVSQLKTPEIIDQSSRSVSPIREESLRQRILRELKLNGQTHSRNFDRMIERYGYYSYDYESFINLLNQQNYQLTKEMINQMMAVGHPKIITKLHELNLIGCDQVLMIAAYSQHFDWSDYLMRVDFRFKLDNFYEPPTQLLINTLIDNQPLRVTNLLFNQIPQDELFSRISEINFLAGRSFPSSGESSDYLSSGVMPPPSSERLHLR